MNGAKLIAIHRSRYFQTAGGLAMGPGPFVSALEFASGVQAQCLGKPEPEFFNAVLRDMGVAASETVMIGDVRRDPVHLCIIAIVLFSMLIIIIALLCFFFLSTGC